MTIYVEGNHALEFILDFEEKSVDAVTLATGQNLKSGAVLGKNAVAYVAHDPAATDGSQNATAILMYDTDATAGDMQVSVIARDASVYDGKLIWKTGITAVQKAAAIASLETKLVTVRS